jgi:hypothetical protein
MVSSARSARPACLVAPMAQQVDSAAYIEKGSPWENGYVESFNSLPPDLIP